VKFRSPHPARPASPLTRGFVSDWIQPEQPIPTDPGRCRDGVGMNPPIRRSGSCVFGTATGTGSVRNLGSALRQRGDAMGRLVHGMGAVVPIPIFGWSETT
jgi:hypothetical protein